MGLEEGDRITFTLLSNGTVLMRAKNKSALEVGGRLQKKGPQSVADRGSVARMIGLNTNVLVRFRAGRRGAVRAGPPTHPTRSAGRRPVCMSLLVLLVLRSRYQLNKAEILSAFSDLLSVVDLQLEDEAAIEEALFVWQDASAQFADCLIGAPYRALECSATATFDAGALKLPGVLAA